MIKIISQSKRIEILQGAKNIRKILGTVAVGISWGEGDCKTFHRCTPCTEQRVL